MAPKRQPDRQVSGMSPTHCPVLPHMNQIWLVDRRVGIISLCMWAGTEAKVYPLLTAWENIQSLSAMVFMFVLVVAWPTWRLESYMQWRVPILAFLRTYLIALPFNFSTEVFNAIAPAAATGRLALVANVFQLFMAIRIALLTFTSLGWRVPFRLHMVLQAINISIFIRYGLHPYCQSTLLSSPQLQGAAAMLHHVMARCTRLFMVNITVAAPQGEYEQRVAFVLFCWFVLGWVMPALLLVTDEQQQQQQQQQQLWQWLGDRQWRCGGWLLRGVLWLLSKVAGMCEVWLQGLRAPSWCPQQRADNNLQTESLEDEGSGNWLYYASVWVLQWWVMLLVAWRLACHGAAMLL